MIDRQPPERIPELLAACDAAFISFMPDPLFEKTIPAKLQSYMACGMPIIAVANGETKRIVGEAECGLCSNIGNVQELNNNIEQLIYSNDLNRMSKASVHYYASHFNKNKIMTYIDSYYR